MCLFVYVFASMYEWKSVCVFINLTYIFVFLILIQYKAEADKSDYCFICNHPSHEFDRRSAVCFVIQMCILFFYTYSMRLNVGTLTHALVYYTMYVSCIRDSVTMCNMITICGTTYTSHCGLTESTPMIKTLLNFMSPNK